MESIFRTRAERIKESDCSTEASEFRHAENLDESAENTALEAMADNEVAESSCRNTWKSMIAENGQYMSTEHIERLSKIDEREIVTVMPAEEYVEQFPDAPFSVIGHCDPEGYIYMKNISAPQIEHTSTHETIHLCSYREFGHSFDRSEEKVGLRRTIRDNEDFSLTRNRGINEGVTEMYTVRELDRRGALEKGDNLHCYEQSVMWAKRLEYMVGKETVAKAYFSGEDIQLKVRFNDLNGNELDAWDQFSKDVDTVEYNNNEEAVKEANRRLSEQFARMYINKNSGRGVL